MIAVYMFTLDIKLLSVLVYYFTTQYRIANVKRPTLLEVVTSLRIYSLSFSRDVGVDILLYSYVRKDS